MATHCHDSYFHFHASNFLLIKTGTRIRTHASLFLCPPVIPYYFIILRGWQCDYGDNAAEGRDQPELLIP